MSIDAQLSKHLPAVDRSNASHFGADQVGADQVRTARIGADQGDADRAAGFLLDIHLRAPSSAITVLLGPSGSGKTLTLNCIAGFARPDKGRILISDRLYFDGLAGVHVPPQLRHCGYVFQDHALFPHMTLRENLRFAASVSRPRTAALTRRRRINELIEAFELNDLATRKPAQLSGGQKQRAALARILVSEPRLVLLDEPTRGLDERLRQNFYSILRETQQRLGIPMLVVTHDLEECFQLADYVCLMDKGKFLQDGPGNVVLCEPASAEAARFLGLYSLVPAEILALDPSRNTSQLRLLDQEIDAGYLPGHLIGDRGLACIRRSDIGAVAAPKGNGGELVLNLLGAHPDPRGVRLYFAGDLSTVVSDSEHEALRGLSRLTLQIPASALSFFTS